MKPVAVALVAAGIAAGVSAETLVDGGSRAPAVHARKPASRGGPAGAHGLMLFPLADPDAHARNGAQSMESAP
jgi:hypothetical protein